MTRPSPHNAACQIPFPSAPLSATFLAPLVTSHKRALSFSPINAWIERVRARLDSSDSGLSSLSGSLRHAWGKQAHSVLTLHRFKRSIGKCASLPRLDAHSARLRSSVLRLYATVARIGASVARLYAQLHRGGAIHYTVEAVLHKMGGTTP